jgi:NAD+ synthase
MKTSSKPPFSKDILVIKNIEEECNRIVNILRDSILHKLNRSGAVIGISGGIDSSVSMALTSLAIPRENILAIMMPEHDSSDDSARLAQDLANKFGIKAITENISGALEGFSCYGRRDEAVRSVFPEYNSKDYKMKIGIRSSGLFTNLPPLFSVTIVDKNGVEQSKRVPAPELRQIEAASNFKQRSRMSMLYYHAEKLHYAVIGTPNKHEVEQGFFVKNGDSGADVMPIAHLYKTQVYQLAHYLGVPEEIIKRTPTSDTYSAEQTQEEFFFQMPFHEMDLLWHAFKNDYEAAEVAEVMGRTPDEISKVFTGFQRRIKTTDYLRMAPITM